jgi:dTMP kinase
LELEYGMNGIPQPNVSIFLDVPWSFTEGRLKAAREGADRDYLKGGCDIHEASLELQKRVRAAYLDLAAGGFVRRIDCSDGVGGMDSPDNIFVKIIHCINE